MTKQQADEIKRGISDCMRGVIPPAVSSEYYKLGYAKAVDKA